MPSSSTSSPTASSSAASARPSASRPSSSIWASRRRASSATSCRSSGARRRLSRRRAAASLPAPSTHAARRAPFRRLALLALLVLQLVLCPSHPSSGASLGFYFLALGPLLIAALPSRRKLRTAVEEDAQKALLRAVAYPHLIALPLLLGIAGAQQWGLHSACGSSGLQVELEFLLYIMSGDEGRGPIGTAEAEAYRAAHDLRELAFMLIVILVPTLIAGALALTWFCKSRKGGGGGLPSLRKGGGGKGAQANGLEKGWKPVTGADGSTYYYNKKTKETTFEFPGVGTGGDDDDTDMDEASDPPPAPEGFFGRTVSKFRGKKADGGMGRTATMTKKAKAKEGASDAPPPAAQKTVFISCR